MKAISIHAPRRGSDIRLSEIKKGSDNFNPRSPQGERHPIQKMCNRHRIFQSTLPAGGATAFP